MPSSTGYRWSPSGQVLAESGLPTVGQAAFGTQWAYGHYDFAVQGGAVSAISLMGAGNRIPAKSLVIGGFVRVVTALNSGGSATAALSVEGANDLIAATAFGSAPWSSTGTKAVVPVFTAATAIHVTAARDIVLTVAAATLTAGVFDVFLAYIPIND